MRTGSLRALVLASSVVSGVVASFVPSVALADSRTQLTIGDGIATIAAPTTDVTEILASVGYDAPRGAVGSTLTARVALVPHLALVGGASTEVGPWRPRLGAIGSLRLGTTDLAVTGQYKAQGFNEPEGELEMIVSAGHRLGAAYTIVEAAFGADFDGRDRDGELAAAVTLPIVSSSSCSSTHSTGSRWFAIFTRLATARAVSNVTAWTSPVTSTCAPSLPPSATVSGVTLGSPHPTSVAHTMIPPSFMPGL